MRVSSIVAVALGILLIGSPPSNAQFEDQKPTTAKPRLNEESWVMFEIWPAVGDITLSAYFLDFSSEKNRNLCEAAKRVFDREQRDRSSETGKSYSSFRICMSVRDAAAQGYFH